MPCQCGEKHQGHLCMLKSKGLTDQVEHLSQNPVVVCFICGAESNSPENVCEPMPIK